MYRTRRTFFDRLAGLVNTEEDEEQRMEESYDDENDEVEYTERSNPDGEEGGENEENWMQEEAEEAELTVDVFQKGSDIVLQTMVAGVKPDDLDVSITREMVTLKGKRERPKNVDEESYFYQELYWGPFSRTIMLPEEVDVEEAEAMSHNGLLTLKMPKIDRQKTQRLKVKNG